MASFILLAILFATSYLTEENIRTTAFDNSKFKVFFLLRTYKYIVWPAQEAIKLE